MVKDNYGSFCSVHELNRLMVECVVIGIPVLFQLEAIYPEVSRGESVCDCDAQHGRQRMYATGSLSDRHLLLTSVSYITL